MKRTGTPTQQLLSFARNVSIGPSDGRSFSDLHPGGYVEISVTDTGNGMPPDVILRVMEPFFTTREEDVGTTVRQFFSRRPARISIIRSRNASIRRWNVAVTNAS